MKISTVQQMRNMDREAIEDYGIAEDLLMENAGQAACTALQRLQPVSGRRVAIFCGIGNNGGDGLVLARKLHALGAEVRLFLLGDPSRFQGAARRNHAIVQRLNLNMETIPSADGLGEELTRWDILVDAIFGTGLSRPVEGLYEQVITLMNRSGRPILSLDIPSGVSGDSGLIMGTAVQATATVTLGLPKIGNFLHPGFVMGGRLYVSHLSFPRALTEDPRLRVSVNNPPPLPPRAADGHKSSFGQALFVAGAAGYLGAPRLAALAFLKAGGGYSRLAAPESLVPFLAVQAGEIVFIPQRQTSTGNLALCNREALLELAASQDFVVIGPGTSLDPESQQLMRTLVEQIEGPLLVDGDGLTALGSDCQRLAGRRGPTVLTPHMGEMARLTGLSIEALIRDRIPVVRQTAQQTRSVIVLKGPHSLIATPEGEVFINPSGNSGLGSAGTGDVLTGTIAAAFGLGLPFIEAICKGVFLHGLAGDLAALAIGEDGMSAEDVLRHLPEALRADRHGLPETLARRYAIPCLD